MNDRIQELSEQVGFDLYSEEKKAMVQEFAELIIRECAQVANDSNQLKNRPMGVSVGDVVRKHFGI